MIERIFSFIGSFLLGAVKMIAEQSPLCPEAELGVDVEDGPVRRRYHGPGLAHALLAEPSHERSEEARSEKPLVPRAAGQDQLHRAAFAGKGHEGIHARLAPVHPEGRLLPQEILDPALVAPAG